MDFEVERRGARWLCLRGEFDLSVAERVVEAARSVADGDGDFVVDLTQVTFMDSGGVRALLRIADEADGVVVYGATAGVRRVLDLTRIDGRRGIRVVDAGADNEARDDGRPAR